MAFTFVVETGNGDPDANSFASVFFADDYIASNVFAFSAWDALDPEDKERFLVRASLYISRMVKWAGSKTDPENGLPFPRTGVYDSDGFEVPADSVPILVQQATCEVASQLASGNDWTSKSNTYGMTEIQVDVIDIKFDSSMTRASLPDFVMQMLADFGRVTSGRRPQFKPIISS